MRVTTSLTTLALLLAAGVAHADDAPLPAGTAPQKAATSGSTDVAKGDAFVTAAAPPEDENKTVNDVAISAGGLFASGNARSVAATAGTKGRIRRDDQQFSFALAANYARAGKVGEPVASTVENVQGLLRYDYYFAEGWSAFLQTSGRHDRFQGLDFRWNVDPGVAHYFIDEKTHRLWAELGYDFQYDTRTQEAQDGRKPGSDPNLPPTETPVASTQASHSVRSFVGYENKLNTTVSFVTSLEYLQSVQHAENARLNFDIGIKAQVVSHLSVATTYSMRFDNNPLPGKANADSLAAVNLVYTLF
jgi:putative salt-induced outer membrane protein